jgi:hypothetical protein
MLPSHYLLALLRDVVCDDPDSGTGLINILAASALIVSPASVAGLIR